MTPTRTSTTAVLSEGLARYVARARQLLTARAAEAVARAEAAAQANRDALIAAIEAVVPEELREWTENGTGEIDACSQQCCVVLRLPGHCSIISTFERIDGNSDTPKWRQRAHADGGNNDPLAEAGARVFWTIHHPNGRDRWCASTIAGAIALAEIDKTELDTEEDIPF